jgi:hypothetical protein
MPFKDPEARKAYSRQHYLENRDSYIQKAKEWHDSNQEKARKAYTKWADKVGVSFIRSYYRNYGKKWRMENPERYAVKNRQNNHRRKNAIGSYNTEDWQRILLEHSNSCAICKSDSNITIDHVIPLSKGGTNFPDNLQPLCRSCNSRKGASIV